MTAIIENENRVFVSKKNNPNFKGDEITIRWSHPDGNLRTLLTGDKYPDYTPLGWKADPKKTKQEHFEAISKFYQSLRRGDFDRATGRLPPGVLLVGNCGQTSLHLDYLEDDPERIINDPHFEEFLLLRIDTPYAAITMEDYTGLWEPETGRIGVITHQDLSDPVSQLFTQTARYHPAKTEEMAKALKRVYQF